jgi:hypothetical protein
LQTNKEEASSWDRIIMTSQGEGKNERAKSLFKIMVEKEI